MSNVRLSEGEYLRWIRARFQRRKGVPIDIGDDAAFVALGGGRVLITTDILVDGTHFDSRKSSPWWIGRKAMAKNLSDIAAMGAIPRFAVVSIALPRMTHGCFAFDLFRGLQSMAERFQTEIVGGDVVSHRGGAAINVTLMGESPRRASPVRRSGARNGDKIMVTGSLGGSILGKHLRFTPRVKEGLSLNVSYHVHAMIDVSDGLSRDLSHICDESRKGAVLDADSVPISAAARRLSAIDGKSPLEHALNDGEDYELLFTASPADAGRIRRKGLAKEIGVIVKGTGVVLRSGNDEKLLSKGGYEHTFGA